MMKKNVYLTFLLFLCAFMAKAQEPAICGDWIGVYEGPGLSNELNEDGKKYFITKDIKAYLRINSLTDIIPSG